MEKSYEQYKAEDFLEDPKFIRWMEGDAEAKSFWENWLQEHPEKKEEADLAKKLFKILSSEEEVRNVIDKEALWDRIREHSKREPTGPDQSVSEPYPWRRILAYAAMFALLVMAAVYFWPVDHGAYQTVVGEMKRVSLPDESVAVLNASSKLEYGETDTSRSLYLEGEVFFDVQEGKEFSVESKHGLVSVLGTSFNVLDRDDYYEVVCQSGRVWVKIKGKDAFILTRGEFVRRTSDGSIETNDDTQDLIQAEAWTSWTEGEFFFKDVPLKRVVREMERQFGVNIHMSEEMKDIRGAFYFTNDNLEQALENVLWPLRIEFEKRGKDIFLKRQ